MLRGRRKNVIVQQSPNNNNITTEPQQNSPTKTTTIPPSNDNNNNNTASSSPTSSNNRNSNSSKMMNNSHQIFFSFPSHNVHYKFLVIQHSFLLKKSKRILYMLSDQLYIQEIVHDSLPVILEHSDPTTTGTTTGTTSGTSDKSIMYSQIQQIQVSNSNHQQFTIHFKHPPSSKVRKETFTLVDEKQLDAFLSLLYRFQSFDFYQVKPIMMDASLSSCPYHSFVTFQYNSKNTLNTTPTTTPTVTTTTTNSNNKKSSNSSSSSSSSDHGMTIMNNRYFVTKWKKCGEKSDQVLCILKSCILSLDAMNSQNVQSMIDVMAIDQLIQVSSSPNTSTTTSNHNNNNNNNNSNDTQQQQQFSALIIVMKHETLHYAYKQHYYYITNDVQAIISCIQLAYHHSMSHSTTTTTTTSTDDANSSKSSDHNNNSKSNSSRNSKRMSQQQSMPHVLPVVIMDEQQVTHQIRTMNPYAAYMNRNHFQSLLSLTQINHNNNHNNTTTTTVTTNTNNNNNSSHNNGRNHTAVVTPPPTTTTIVSSSSSPSKALPSVPSPSSSSTATPTPPPFMIYHSIQRMKSNQQQQIGVNRLLFMNYDYLIETDADGKFVHSVHSMKSVHCLVRHDGDSLNDDHHDGSLSSTPPTVATTATTTTTTPDNDSSGNVCYFSIEFRNGTKHTYRTSAPNRDIILLNMMQMANYYKHNNNSINSNNNSHNSQTVFITSEMTIHGLREGSHHSYCNDIPCEEYGELLMKKLNQLDKFSSIRDKTLVLRELVMSYQLIQLPIKDKSILKHLVRWYQAMTSASHNIRILALILNSISRILPYKIVYEELLQQGAQYKGFIEKLIQQLGGDQYDSTIKYYSAVILFQLCCISVRSYKLNDQSYVIQFINQVLFNSNSLKMYSDCISMATTNSNNHNDSQKYLYILTIDVLFNMYRHVYKLKGELHHGSNTASSPPANSNDGSESSVAIEILSRCTENLFELRQALYRLARAKPISTIHIVLDLLILLSVRAKNSELETIQNDVLNNGLIICLIHDSLFSPLSSIRNKSIQLCDLLISFHSGCYELMTRIVPLALLRDLNTGTTRKEVSINVTKSLFGKTKLKQNAEYFLQTQNWRKVLESLHKDYENADIIWNDGTRLDLKTSLQYQIESLDSANDRNASNCVWNFIEFKVVYSSLKNEPKVGQYYLRYIAAQKGKRISLDEPLNLLRDVYYHLMLEEQEDLKLLSAKALTNIYVNELFPDSIPFPHLDHVIEQMTSGRYSRSIIYEIFNLLTNAIIVWENANVINDKCIPLLMSFVKEVHTLKPANQSSQMIDECNIPGRMATLALNILYQLSLFRTRKLREGQIIRPIPATVRVITEADNLSHIIQLLTLGMYPTVSSDVDTVSTLKNRTKLIQQAIPLVHHLLMVNDIIVKRVYETGLFYMLFCCIEGEDNEGTQPSAVVNKLDSDQAGLLKLIHVRQEFDPAQFNINTISPDMDQETETSFLRVLLPHSIVKYLTQKSGSEFASLFGRDNLTPTIIWNREMRLHLQKAVRGHLAPFVEQLSSSTEPIVYRHEPIQRIVYPQIENELYIKGYYLSGLLDPKWSGYKVDNPLELFNSVVQHFNATEMNSDLDIEHLGILMRTQLLLFDQCKMQMGISTYAGLFKCLDILARFCNEQNGNNQSSVRVPIELAESVVRFLYFSVHPSSIEDITKANGHAILCTLLQTSHLKLLKLQSSADETKESSKHLNYFKLILQGTCELIGKLFQYGEVTKNYIQKGLHFDLSHLLLHHICNCKPEDTSVFKSVARLLSSTLCTIRPLAQKLWRCGILYILLHFICQRELSSPNDVVRYKYSQQVLLSLYHNDRDMVLQDLSLLLPDPLVKRFARSVPPNTTAPSPSSNAHNDQLRNDLLRDAETPYLIWNEAARTILIDHIESHYNTLSPQYQHASEISVVYNKLSYPIFDCELRIANIYVRLFNNFVQTHVGKMNSASYANVIEEPKQFLTGLVQYVAQDSPAQNQKPMVVEAIYNLLKYAEAIDVNTLLQRELIENCLSLPEGQTALFKSLKDFYTKRSETEPVTYEYLCNVIRMCLTNSPVFMQRTSSTKVFHLLVYAFVYTLHLLQNHEKQQHHQQENKEFADRILACLLRIMGPSIVDIHICEAVLQSGILLYLICMLCGALPFIEDVHKQSTLKILSTLCQRGSGTSSESPLVITLHKLLPSPIVNMIAQGKYDAILYYQQNQENPDMIWKESMRRELVQYLKTEMSKYEAQVQNHQLMDITHIIGWLGPTQSLQYSAVESELQVAGIYVRLFNEIAGFGTNKSSSNNQYKLADPLGFLSQLVTRCIQINAQTLDDKQKSLFTILSGIFNVMNWDRCQYTKHESMSQLIATLFDILESQQTIVDNIILVLHIFYRMCDPFRGNQTFVEKFSQDKFIDRLFAQMLLMEDYMEMFLYVLLAYVRTSSSTIKYLIDGDRIRLLFSVVFNSDKAQQLKNRTAMLLMSISTDERYGLAVVNSELWRQQEEKWNQQYANIELPPIDAPLPMAVNSLRVNNESTVQRKRMSLPDIPKSNVTISIVRSDPSEQVTVPVVAPIRPPTNTTPAAADSLPPPPKPQPQSQPSVNIVTLPPANSTSNNRTLPPTPPAAVHKTENQPPVVEDNQVNNENVPTNRALPLPPTLLVNNAVDNQDSIDETAAEAVDDQPTDNNIDDNAASDSADQMEGESDAAPTVDESANANDENAAIADDNNNQELLPTDPSDAVEDVASASSSGTPPPPPPMPLSNGTTSPPPPPMNMPPPSPASMSAAIPPPSNGRNDLLAQIRNMQSLRKVSDSDKKYSDAPMSVGGSGSGNSSPASSPVNNPLLAAIIAKQQALLEANTNTSNDDDFE